MTEDAPGDGRHRRMDRKEEEVQPDPGAEPVDAADPKADEAVRQRRIGSAGGGPYAEDRRRGDQS